MKRQPKDKGISHLLNKINIQIVLFGGYSMKLTVVGLGYIGLPTSIMFAKHGVDVLGVDINQQTIDKLQSGQISIEEPGLQEGLSSSMMIGKI